MREKWSWTKPNYKSLPFPFSYKKIYKYTYNMNKGAYKYIIECVCLEILVWYIFSSFSRGEYKCNKNATQI